MIVLGAILPHPPILLPEIGQGREQQAAATLEAYAEVADLLRSRGVKRVVLISTHGIVTLNRFHILTADLSGDFERFGHRSLTFERTIDADLTAAITESAANAQIPLIEASHWEQCDHSVGVPLRLLGEALPDRMAIVSISFRSPEDHLQLGAVIGRALSAIDEPTAIIASGDAVHTLTEDAPNGLHPRAAEVQAEYERALELGDLESLCAIDESLRREVDESVISPTLILIGAMSANAERPPRPRMLASESPWGIGYVTAVIDPHDQTAPLRHD